VAADVERGGSVSEGAGGARRALVTGAAGFVGQWLCRALLRHGWGVSGLALEQPNELETLTDDERNAIRWYDGDIRDRDVFAGALGEERPDAVFHLAGVSYVPSAEADPGVAYDVNVTATARLLSLLAARRTAGELDPVMLLVGSAEQYGRHDLNELPLGEHAEQRPLGVYAATKAAQEIAGLQSWRKDGLRVIATRPFNHSGPGQSDRFLLPALVRRALDLRARGARELPIGNVEPVRDISHVRDVVRAYILLAEHGEPGLAYNICSGVGTSVGELARRVLSRAGVPAALQPDPALMRAADVPALVGSPALLSAATAWAPEHTLDDLIDDLIDAATH